MSSTSPISGLISGGRSDFVLEYGSLSFLLICHWVLETGALVHPEGLEQETGAREKGGYMISGHACIKRGCTVFTSGIPWCFLICLFSICFSFSPSRILSGLLGAFILVPMNGEKRWMVTLMGSSMVAQDPGHR